MKLTQRKYPRYDFTSPVEYVLESQIDKNNFKGISTNLSKAGMCLLSPHQLNRGQEIQIRSNLPDYNQKAVIRWSTNLNDILCKAGLEFEFKEHDRGQIINELLDLLKSLDNYKLLEPQQIKLENALNEFLNKLQISNNQLKKSYEELSAIHQLTIHINTSLSFDEVITSALKEIMDIISPDIAFLYLRQDNILVLKNVCQKPGTNRPVLPETKDIGECLCGLAASKGKPYYSSNIHTDPLCTLSECKQAGIHSFAALPLCIREEILGVLSLASFKERDFSEQRAFLEVLSNHIAIALQNAFLYKKILEHVKELEKQIQERSKAEAALRKNEKELTKRVKELDEFYNIAVGRELKMKALKEEIESLKKELGKYNKHENIASMK
jgi:putative methionine-R-sulfoxide reductase with GAF domain